MFDVNVKLFKSSMHLLCKSRLRLVCSGYKQGQDT